MIVVQNMDMKVVDTSTTLKGFMREYDGKGTCLKSYKYVQEKLKHVGIGNKLKYRKFYITRTKNKGSGAEKKINFKL